MPTQHGESVVMRLLDQSGSLMTLDKLGMAPTMLERFRELIKRSAGMVLVTGPTGSGKTTTLYSALNHLNQPDTKIITVEDPVEYRLDRVNQVQVNTKIGLDFARVLRTTLRQDPDIILVGEMRDQETVDIGLRAAITGHLVFSTLHTMNAVATIHRLLDMGAAGYMIAAALHGIVAQRLVRRVCDNCAQPTEPRSAAARVARRAGRSGARREDEFPDGRRLHVLQPHRLSRSRGHLRVARDRSAARRCDPSRRLDGVREHRARSAKASPRWPTPHSTSSRTARPALRKRWASPAASMTTSRMCRRSKPSRRTRSIRCCRKRLQAEQRER